MKQPELGRKIAETRLAKGLTQGELASQCNLSLRTIQRIESGQVSPRSFTVKLIFSQLGQSVYDSVPDSFAPPTPMQRIQSRLDQAKIFITDLFNFKKDRMKKITLLSAPILSMLVLYLFTSWNSNAQNQEKERAALLAANTQLVTLFNSGQLKSLMQLYSDKSCIVAANFGEITGKKEILEYYKVLYSSGFRFEENRSKSLVISDSIAIDRGYWSGILKDKLNGSYLTHWRLIDGKWHIENDMTSLDTKL